MKDLKRQFSGLFFILSAYIDGKIIVDIYTYMHTHTIPRNPRKPEKSKKKKKNQQSERKIRQAPRRIAERIARTKLEGERSILIMKPNEHDDERTMPPARGYEYRSR